VVQERVVFRRRVRWFLVALLGGVGLVPLSGVFVGDTAAQPSVLQRVVCSVLLAATVVLGVRVSRLAVVIDERGVCVRNVFRDYRMRWEEIASVAPPARYGAWRKAGIRIERENGGGVSASAFVHGLFDNKDLGQTVVQAMRERLPNHG
jgi:hypothetical protein